MRIAIIAATLILSACSGGNKDADANATAATQAPPASVAVTQTPTVTAYPLPASQPAGMVNPDADPEVAKHIARQERCAHWRSEQEGGAVRPEVAEGLTRECVGIDAELDALRRKFDADGKSISLLRPFRPVER